MLRRHVAYLTAAAVLSGVPGGAHAQQFDLEQVRIPLLRFDEGTTLQDALNTILEASNVSVMIPLFGTAQDSVRVGRLVLRNVSVADALTNVLQPLNLRYVVDPGNFLRIELDIVRRIIRYEYLAGRFAIGGGAGGMGGAAGAAGAAGGAAGGVAGAGGMGVMTPEQFEEQLEEFLSNEGMLKHDRETHTIWVEDYAVYVQRLVDYVETIDVPLRQVEIAVQLVEVVRTDDTQYGVEGSVEMTGGTDVESVLIDLPGLIGTGFQADLQGFALGGLYGGDLDLNAALRAITTVANAELLSRPRTVVMDNKPATIDLTDQIPYTEALVGTGFVTASTQFKDVGILLTVTPTILDSSSVQLQINLEVSSAATRTAEGVPTVANRRATSQVVVGDGQVFVMGGLLRREETDTVTGIPLLMHIPLLGKLFSTTTTRFENRELLLLVEPRIIPPDTFEPRP